MSKLMPLPLTVSCFRKIQVGFTFLVPAHPGSPGQRAVKRVRVSTPALAGKLVRSAVSVSTLALNRLTFDINSAKGQYHSSPCIESEDDRPMATVDVSKDDNAVGLTSILHRGQFVFIL